MNPSLSLIFETDQDGHYFSGYYDVNPISSDGKSLLCLQVSDIYKLPEAGDTADIVIFDLKSKHKRKIAEVNVYNFQQGAKLHWIEESGRQKIIYNYRNINKFVSRILNVESGEFNDLDQAVYCISPDQKSALCIDYERHFWFRRGYAYAGIENANKKKKVSHDDYISVLNLGSGEYKKIITVKDVLQLKSETSMTGASHYLEHMMFSPKGDKFTFYHRWKTKTGDIHTRLILSSLSDPENLRIIHDSGRLTHMCWRDDSNLVCIGTPRTSVATVFKKHRFLHSVFRLLRPVYRALIKGSMQGGQTKLSQLITGDMYFNINIDTRNISIIGSSSLRSDGHPTVLGNTLITDTYPGDDDAIRLILFDLPNDKISQVKNLASNPILKNSPVRCDLHPKVDSKHRLVSIDSSHKPFRSIQVYSI